MHNWVGKKFQSINQGALGHVQTAVHPQGNRNWVNGELIDYPLPSLYWLEVSVTRFLRSQNKMK